MTPSTNKCCELCMQWKMKHSCKLDVNGFAICACSEHEPYCSNPQCPSCHKPTEPSVCGVFWESVDGHFSGTCKEPKPCPLHDKPKCGSDGKTMWCYCGKCKQEDYPLPKDMPLHEPSEVNYVDARTPEEREADKKIEDTAIITTATFTPQQEEASWEKKFDHDYGDYLPENGFFLKHNIKSFIRTEIAQAEKRGEVRAYNEMEKMIDTAEVVATYPLSQPDDVLRARTMNEVLMPGVKKELKDRLTALKNHTHE